MLTKFIFHYLLGVIYEKHAEEQSHESTVYSVHDGIAVDGEYDGNDPEEEQYPAASEKVHAPTWLNNLSNDKGNFHMKYSILPVMSILVWNEKMVSPRQMRAVIPIAMKTQAALW